MHVVIAYDIRCNAVRRQLFAFLKEKGLPSQRSVFECSMDASTLASVQRFVQNLELDEQDSVLFYPLCRRCARQSEILGQGITMQSTDWVVW